MVSESMGPLPIMATTLAYSNGVVTSLSSSGNRVE
jgi:hypothetical protein